MLLPKLQAEGKSLDDLIAELKQPLETQEVRFKLEAADYRALGEQVIADLRQTSLEGFVFNPDNEEGVRFDLTEPYGDGWLLLRMSLHEPLLVLQVENDQTGYIPERIDLMEKGVGVGKNSTNKKEFVSPPPHS